MPAEGVRLQIGDILETGDATFVQAELADQTVLQMGPKSRVMVGGPVRLKAERTLYALSGWFKLSNARKDGNVRAFEFRSPLIEIGLLPGVVVMQLKTNEATLFAERGDFKLVERPGGTALGVRQGQTYRRTAGARGTLGGSAPTAFVAEMPKAFRDSLPLRADKYREREVQPRRGARFRLCRRRALAEGRAADPPPVHAALAQQGARAGVPRRAGRQLGVAPRMGSGPVPGKVPAESPAPRHAVRRPAAASVRHRLPPRR